MTITRDPRRSTSGQLLETLCGKLAALKGEIGDGTPFRGVSIDAVADELENCGYERHGCERLVNGMTGEVMDGRVFIGPATYQRLKHMVEDKRHARSRGPVQVRSRVSPVPSWSTLKRESQPPSAFRRRS